MNHLHLQRLVAAWLLSFGAAAANTAANAAPRDASWHRFGANVNYRLTAVVEVNGGAGAAPNFETSVSASGESWPLQGEAPADATPGYSIPIDVLTLHDGDGRYRQRVAYYSGMQVEYNNNGAGYKFVPTPFQGGHVSDKEGAKTCFKTGGHSSDVGGKQVGYLNFFPTVEQMGHYTVGKLITAEDGVPYRLATLEAPHGSFNATSTPSQPDASYTNRAGMPSNDWFEFHYRESLSSSGGPLPSPFLVPLKWTMLARDQIINAHTENWVVRYLSYKAIDTDKERELWEGWFDDSFDGDCGEQSSMLLAQAGRNLQHNRLGMFFSSSSRAPPAAAAESPTTNPSNHFDLFLARHNKHYPHAYEYAERRAVHDTNTKNIAKWNREHAGRTEFAANEFLDLELKEVMQIRGGHIPGEKVGRNLRAADNGRSPQFLLGDISSTHQYDTYELPNNFDPSTLPVSFDWRAYPGTVGPIKDQGFCGSCWAFSFLSALESHWFIAHGQSVVLPEQFVNDCAWSRGASGCDGGNANTAAAVVIDRFQGKVPTRDAYGGYLSIDGECYVNVLQEAGLMGGSNGLLSSAAIPSSSVQLTNWMALPPRDDVVAKHALFTQGPLSVAFNVVDESLYYSNGVLDVAGCRKNGPQDLDHAINLVGWGVDVAEDGSTAQHWILRNSWSVLWGDKGYFKVRMGERDCGVTTNAGYPVVAKPVTPLTKVAIS